VRYCAGSQPLVEMFHCAGSQKCQNVYCTESQRCQMTHCPTSQPLLKFPIVQGANSVLLCEEPAVSKYLILSRAKGETLVVWMPEDM